MTLLDKLLSLMVDGKWVEHFPPMPTKRFRTAVVSTEKYLVLAGGSRLDTVEVMDVNVATLS